MSRPPATRSPVLGLLLLGIALLVSGCGDGQPTNCPAVARACDAGESPRSSACGCEPRTCATTVSPEDPLADRFEGATVDDVCRGDGDCVVSGCSDEVCSAALVLTTCEALSVLPEGSCACVAGRCRWAVCSGP